MKKTLILVTALVSFLGLTTSAFAAITTTLTASPWTMVAGATTIDFNSSLLLPAGYSMGGVFNTTTWDHAAPPGSTGNYYSVGLTTPQLGPGIVTFATPVSYFGFYWGSPDSYNTVTFYDGAHELGSFDGSDVYAPADGNQSVGIYFNAFVTGGTNITRVVFASSNNAFETDNHAFIAAVVPEPKTNAMLLAGLGLIGFIARRRSI